MTEPLKLDIVHYYKVEYYPPIINLIQQLNRDNRINYRVYTTSSNNCLLEESADFRTKRLVITNSEAVSPIRILRQLYFNLATLICLIRRNPDVILYYETISCGGPVLYKRFFNKKVRIFVHYHELTTKEQLKCETRVVRLLNPVEKRTYRKFHWISHTNNDRIRLFIQEHKNYLKQGSLQTMPNFPPYSWKDRAGKVRASWGQLNTPVRTVLTGSVSSTSMYLKEYCNWVIQQDGKFTFDVYTFNIDTGTRLYLENLKSPYIQLHSAVPYNKLPELFADFDIGVILYKAREANMRYNSPNKLFEYHMCGLDVWFPQEQKTAHQYIKIASYPKIIAVDFQNLSTLHIDGTLGRNGLLFHQNDFSCEKIYSRLIAELKTLENLHPSNHIPASAH